MEKKKSYEVTHGGLFKKLGPKMAGENMWKLDCAVAVPEV